METLYSIFLFLAMAVILSKLYIDLFIFPLNYDSYLVKCYDNYIAVLETCLKHNLAMKDIPAICKYFKSIKEKNQYHIVSEYIVSLFIKKRFLKEIVRELYKIENEDARNLIKNKIKDTNAEYRLLVKRSSLIARVGDYFGKFNTMRKV